jgi:hypothetical protein
LRQPSNSTAQTSVTQPGGKPKDSLPQTLYTGEQWEQDMLETCKRVNAYTEEQQIELAKRQF